MWKHGCLLIWISSAFLNSKVYGFSQASFLEELSYTSSFKETAPSLLSLVELSELALEKADRNRLITDSNPGLFFGFKLKNKFLAYEMRTHSQRSLPSCEQVEARFNSYIELWDGLTDLLLTSASVPEEDLGDFLQRIKQLDAKILSLNIDELEANDIEQVFRVDLKELYASNAEFSKRLTGKFELREFDWLGIEALQVGEVSGISLSIENKTLLIERVTNLLEACLGPSELKLWVDVEVETSHMLNRPELICETKLVEIQLNLRDQGRRYISLMIRL